MHAKTIFDKIVDIVAFAAEVASIANGVPMLPQDQLLPTALVILKKLSSVHSKLQAFYSELDAEFPGPLYWEQALPTEPDISGDKHNSDLTFAPALCFPNLQAASTITTYWAICTLFWAGQIDLYNLFAAHGMTHIFTSAMGDHTPQTMQFLW